MNGVGREADSSADADGLRTIDDWVAFYRNEYGLPVTERGGFVMLPVSGRVCAVHLPTVRAEKVRAALEQQGTRGPVLARQIRWSFLAEPDARPGAQVLEVLDRLDIGIPAIGSALMLPTGLGRWTREGCFWVDPPGRGGTLPPLSAVVTTALAVGAGGGD
ncbi:hypothetical protein [Nocardia bovistercoris]|uniref:hypothetical protein n=1 Tax=Nocardia bovistercoris TaxID=2785916 RepID=UPI001E32E937|nr:hypothetical protein [Nocardia bovistercoris]